MPKYTKQVAKNISEQHLTTIRTQYSHVVDWGADTIKFVMQQLFCHLQIEAIEASTTKTTENVYTIPIGYNKNNIDIAVFYYIQWKCIPIPLEWQCTIYWNEESASLKVHTQSTEAGNANNSSCILYLYHNKSQNVGHIP